MKELSKISELAKENIRLIDEISIHLDRIEVEKQNLRLGINLENDLPADDNAMINIVGLEDLIKTKERKIQINSIRMKNLAKGD